MKDFVTKIDNNDTSAGFVDAEDFNSVFNEAENAVKPFFALSLADNQQLAKAIDVASKATRYTDTGTANTVTLSRGATTQTIETLIDGITLTFTPAIANTGATTLKIKTLTAKPLKYLGADLPAGFLQTDSLYLATYDSTNDWFECEKVINKRNLDSKIATERKQYAKQQLPIVMVDGTNVLTATQNENGYYILSGTLTADAILQIDINLQRDFIVKNSTIGGFSVTVQGATGTGKIIPTGETLFLYCNGTNVESGQETGLLSTNNFMHIQDQKTSGTSGGTSVSATNNIRDLNTIISNTIDGASLSANQFTLPAGTYLIKATSSCFKGVLTREKIYNVTDSVYVAVGVNVYMNATYVTGTPVSVESVLITISSPKTFEVRTYTSNGSVDGLGIAILDGIEIYTDLQIYQLKKG